MLKKITLSVLTAVAALSASTFAGTAVRSIAEEWIPRETVETNFDAPRAPQAEAIDLATVQSKEVQGLAIPVPAGWQTLDRPKMVATISADRSMAFGVLSTGKLEGRAGPDQCAMVAFADVMNLPEAHFSGGETISRTANSMTQSFLVRYTLEGREFRGSVIVGTNFDGANTTAWVSFVVATPEQLKTNARVLSKLAASIGEKKHADERQTKCWN